MRAAYGTTKRGVAVASMGDEARAGDESDRFSLVEVRVEGLETLDCLDNTQNRQRCTEQGDALTFESEVDKIYLSTPTKIAILDHEKKRTFVIRKDVFQMPLYGIPGIRGRRL